MDKPLSKNQQAAAALLAKGKNNLEAAEICGVSESTILRWKRLDAFQQAVSDIKTASARQQLEQLLPADEGDSDIKESLDIEAQQLEKLDALIDRLFNLCSGIFDTCLAEDVSPRALPALLKALSGLLESRRSGGDRLLGIAAILDELNGAEKIFSEKTTPSESRG